MLYMCVCNGNRGEEGISQSRGEGDNFISSDQVQSHTRSKKPKRLLSAGLTFHSVRYKKILRLDWADKLNPPVVFQTQHKTQMVC